MTVAPNFLPLDDEWEEDLARAYIEFQHTKPKTPEWAALFWTYNRMSHLTKHLPLKAWRVILAMWSMHQCPRMIENLCFGPIRSLLSKHTSQMLPIIEAEAHRDASFAKLLGSLEQKRLSDEVWLRVRAASEQRGSGGMVLANLFSEQPHNSLEADLKPREDEKDEDLARAYVASQRTQPKSAEWNALFWTHERMSYLTNHLPHRAWRVILLIWSMDQSIRTMQSLSAGEIEDLLSTYGPEIIGLVEAEAQRDPSFAKLLGGVWKNRMTDEVWSRLQTVWDRRGWDGIPDE